MSLCVPTYNCVCLCECVCSYVGVGVLCEWVRSYVSVGVLCECTFSVCACVSVGESGCG